MSIKKPLGLRNELIIGAIAAYAIASTGVAQAAETEDGKGSTVVVTGKRRGDNPYADAVAPYRAVESANNLFTEKIQDTSKSINVITENLLDDMGVSTMRDLFRTQPGITLGTGEGGNAFGDRVFIRGFDARNDVYIDGVRDPGLASREMFATQQVEIMKGPSSAFGGRGTTGGAVSLVSKKPRSIDSTSVEVTLGSDELSRITIDTNHVINDEIAYRVNLMGHKSNAPGRDNVYNNRWGAAFAIDYRPIEKLRFGFDYYHLTTDYMPDWGLPWNSLTQDVGDVGRSTFYGIKNRDFGDTVNDVSTIMADYDFNDDLKLHSVIRYGQVNNRYRATAPEGANFTATALSNGTPAYSLAANAKNRFQLTEYLTNLTNLTWKFKTGSIPHALVVGYEISREETAMRAFAFTECGSGTCTGNAPRIYQNLFNPDFNYPWTIAGESLTSSTNIETQTTAFYAIDTMHFGEKWILMLGLRGDNYQTERNVYTYATSSFGTPIESDSDFFSYHAGLVYKPKENISIYGSYSSSSNPPCEQLDSTAVDYGGCDATTFASDPIENTSFEFGTKINVNGHFDVTAAYFTINRTGVPSVIRVGNVSTLFVEEQEVSGLELTAAGNITKKWSVFSGLTMFESETTNSTYSASQNLGKPFPNVSEMTFTITTKYKLNERLALGGTWVSQSEKFGGTYSAGSNKLPGFNRIDLFGEFEIKEGLKLQFNIQNANDEIYYDALYRSATPYVYIAPGRSYSMTIDWHF